MFKTIKQSIDVNAPKEKVWDVLTKDKYTRIWYSEFGEGSHAETDWKQGSKAVFTDKNKRGMVAKVETAKPHETLSLTFQGVVVDGVEDYTGSEAKSVKGGHETYQLAGTNGSTRLSISSDMSAEMFDTMSKMWDKALKRIKRLSESEANN